MYWITVRDMMLDDRLVLRNAQRSMSSRLLTWDREWKRSEELAAKMVLDALGTDHLMIDCGKCLHDEDNTARTFRGSTV